MIKMNLLCDNGGIA